MILVTGGLGFIGLHTARSLLDLGEDVVLTQYRVARNPDFIQDEIGKRAFVEQLDATDGAKLREIGDRHKIDGIIHLATPGLGALDAAGDFKVNMYSLLNCLEAAEAWGVKRLAIASSITVYSGINDGPFTEDLPLRTTPASPVEAYKKATEIVSTHYAQRTGLNIVLLRIAGIYGPLYHSMGNAVSRLTHAAVKGVAPELRAELYEDDAQDYSYVKDCGRGIALLQAAETLSWQCYNIGAGRASSNKEFADAIRRHYPNAVLPLKPGASVPRKDPFMSLDRIKADTGYEPEYADVDKAMDDYIAWLKDNAE
ncbi:MAG TPA: NAD(P)-dependent oxidoreductase [Dehalococcoidia bacterium]|nr:NAD(P)-dependent oxidoreductase [Dehalococcoidia bacterium]